MKKLKLLIRLLLDFLRIGAFTFGGGWSIVAQMRELYVQKQQIIQDEELLDMLSVGRSLPGIMGCNIALLFGYRTAGVAGGLVCLLGMAIPPLLILILVSFFYETFRSHPWVIAAMRGMRAAVVPIIISAAWNMLKGSFKYPPCYIVTAAVFVLYLFFNVNCVWLTLFGLVAGILISDIYERRGGICHDVP